MIANATVVDGKGKRRRAQIFPSFDGYPNVYFEENGQRWRDKLNPAWKVEWDEGKEPK